jgi:serine/threonine protein kinase
VSDVQQSDFEQIQSLCRDFRRQLKGGARRRIEDYLDRVYESSREMLFQNLLHVEIEYRRRQGESPSSDEFAARFPEFSRQVRQAFFESTLMSMHADVETPADEDTVLLGMPAARKLGDYELLRELGRGGFGVVYEARHLRRNDLVALKTLPAHFDGQLHPLVDAERLHRFRREFRSLSEVNHPNLVGMQSLEVDGRQWFFTMDLVEGVDFLDYVRPKGELDEARLRQSLMQLATGIIALHQQGIVHRDLKPSNVLIAADGRVKIMDFGLVADLQMRSDQTASLHSRQFAGTPRYAAPEQIDGVRSYASDWYAVGVMLFEALTGEAPFSGSHVEVIVQKRTQESPALRQRDGVPADLGELVDQLLQRDPDRRPNDFAVAQRLGISLEGHLHDSTDSSFSKHFKTPLVGRVSQLAELDQARRELLNSRQPVVVFIRGLSGEGKTSLAETFLEKPRLSDELVVLSGRCYDRESAPFKAIDCLIDALVAFLRSRPEKEVQSLLPEDIQMLAQLFPVLRRVEGIAARSMLSLAGIDSRQIRYRAFAALRELLTTIGRSTPLILFIDDLQWGDADSAAALEELLQPPLPPAVMLLGCYRSDEADHSPFLQEWRKRRPDLRERSIQVSVLTAEECATWIAARLGANTGDFKRQAMELYEAAQGNPYILDQLLEGFDAETGGFQALPLKELIARRLGRLPKGATPLLEAIAVAGQAAPLDEVARVAGNLDQAFSTVTHMRSERLVRLIGADDRRLVDTYHDKIRETVLDGMAPERRRKLHVRFGEALEKSENLMAERVLEYLETDPADDDTVEAPKCDRVFDLAYHFHAAGDPRAFAYQLLAGELSYRAYATEDALQFLERAEALLPETASSTLRYRLLDRLGNAHVRLKAPESGLKFLERAIPLAPSGLSRAQTYYWMTAAAAALARHTASIRYCDLALSEIQAPRRWSIHALVAIPFMAARIFLLPHRRWTEGPLDLVQKQSALEQRVHFQLCCLLFESSALGTCYSGCRSGWLAVTSRNRDLFLSGMALFSGVLTYFLLPALGRWQIRRVEAIPIDQVMPDARAEHLRMLGAAHTGSGQLRLARRELEESLPLHEKAGTHFQATYAAHVVRHLLQVIGTSSEEVDAARRVVSLAEEIGDVRAQCWGQYDVACGLARAGDIRTAKRHIENARELLAACEGAATTETIFLATESYVLLQASQHAAARAAAEKSWRLTKKSLIIMEYNLFSLPLLIASIAGPDWSTTPAYDRRTLKRLLWESWCALWTHPVLHPHIHRARGRALWTLGKRRQAVRSFEKAIASAEKLGADYDLARSLLDLAAVKEEGRDAMCSEAVQLLKQQESKIPWAERWLLGDQYDEQCVAPPSREAAAEGTKSPESTNTDR